MNKMKWIKSVGMILWAVVVWVCLFWVNLEANTLLESMEDYKPGNLIDSSETDPQLMTVMLVAKIVNILVYISGTLATIGVIVGGARYMFSFGGDGKDAAKRTITWSLGGLVVVILAYAIVHNVVRLIVNWVE